MDTIDLKAKVAEALALQWPEFKEAHPHLAAAIDPPLLVDSVAQSLADDPGYQQALAAADAAQRAADFAGQFIQRALALLRGG